MATIAIEKALAVIEEYHDVDDYIQACFQNGLRGGEYWDNTMDTWYYWHECKEIVDKLLPAVIEQHPSGWRKLIKSDNRSIDQPDGLLYEGVLNLNRVDGTLVFSLNPVFSR